MLKYFLTIITSFLAFYTNAQEPKIEIQKGLNWNRASEGQEIKFKLNISPDSIQNQFKFSIQQGKIIGMNLDSAGQFSWTPNYNLVDRIESERLIQIIVAAKTNEGQQITNTLDIYVKHINRPPVLNELKTFYVQFNYANTYNINNDLAYDDDLDPIVFIPNLETLPEGMSMSTLGEINWKPSQNQFKSLKEKPLYIEFTIQDQPAKSSTKGKLKVEATQMDLPPQITVIPKNERITTKENENVNLRFYLTDPNGEDDIDIFDFLTNQPGIEKKSLIKNTNNQYEFIWMPGYDFVQDPKDTLSFLLIFLFWIKLKNEK